MRSLGASGAPGTRAAAETLIEPRLRFLLVQDDRGHSYSGVVSRVAKGLMMS